MNDLPKAGPWSTRAEFLVDQALDNALAASAEELRVMRPVAVPQQLFPERTGFAADQWTIGQVLNIDRLTPTYRSWVSGMPVMRTTMSDYTWEGTSRPSSSGEGLQ